MTGLAETAVYGSFDNRVDRHLSYDIADLDSQAWSELGPILDGVLDVVKRLRRESGERMAASGEPPIRTVVGQMMFRVTAAGSAAGRGLKRQRLGAVIGAWAQAG